jgi:hypothetical protein
LHISSGNCRKALLLYFCFSYKHSLDINAGKDEHQKAKVEHGRVMFAWRASRCLVACFYEALLAGVDLVSLHSVVEMKNPVLFSNTGRHPFKCEDTFLCGVQLWTKKGMMQSLSFSGGNGRAGVMEWNGASVAKAGCVRVYYDAWGDSNETPQEVQ